MSHNRHTSSLRKVGRKLKAKNRRSKSQQSSAVNYQTLEPRQLLAIDFGVGSGLVDVTTDTFGGAPNVSAAVGPNHIVQVQNGEFRIFDKATGANLVDKALDTFWTDTERDAAVGAEAAPEMVSNTANSRVVYDVDTRRWFIVSSSAADIIAGAGAEGIQRPVLMAVSRTSDPTLDWQSLADTYDEDNDIVNGTGDPPTPPTQIIGGFLPDRLRANNTAHWSLNLAVDDDSVLVGVTGFGGQYSRTFVFNKFELLVVPQPNTGAFFPNTVQGFDNFGGGTQYNTDVTGEVEGTFGLETDVAVTGGTVIGLLELRNTEGVGTVTEENVVVIPVDPYEAPPRDIRQEFDPDLINAGSGLLNSPVRHGNSLWAVHSIKGASDAQNPDGGIIENSAIRWYEIDLDTKTVKQSGTIQHPWRNYIYPSIAVTELGHVVISYTSTGVSPDGPSFGQFPSVAVSVGYDINGVMTFEEPVVVKDGDGGYLDAIGNFWGSYIQTAADPFDPTKVWVFGQWSSGGSVVNNGQNQITEIELLGHSAILSGDELDNTIIVRRSALDNAQIEVEIDGIVVGTYEEANLYEVILDGGGGEDTFVIDTSNGEFDFPNGVNFNGDGDDHVRMDTVERTNWEVFVDGSGTASVGTNIPAVCEDHSDVVQTFVLNFEAGSGWFDATPYNVDGFATRGDALRADLQNYFDTIIAPLFVNSFSIELDINDDETDSLASARALGFGFEEVNGQNLWVASPWSILTGRGDRNADASDGEIDYNLDVSLYQDDFEALRRNVAGGLTRNQFFRILGMQSEIPNETNTFDPRGTRNMATVLDVGYRDLNNNPLVGNYSATDSMFDVLDYQTNAIWAGDNTGIYFMGVDDDGNPMRLPVNSNSELIDFDTLASALAGTSRDGDFNDIVEQDRAFLRGLGYELNPVVPVEDLPGQPVRFVGMDQIAAGAGEDFFCIRSSNVDLEIRGGAGNDFFNVTGLGVGAIDLHGEAGDDTYQVVFSPAGVITVSDSLDAENDTLIGLGTQDADEFLFVVNGVEVNAGLMVYVGIENISFDGRGADDVFEVRADNVGIVDLIGGAGSDTFIVNDMGAGANNNVLTIGVNDPNVEPIDQLRLGISSVITDTYLSQEIENFQVDGLFLLDGVNGTPTVAGGLNLLGDGDDRLQVDSLQNAAWLVNGDGAGTLTMDVDPMTFTGIVQIDASMGEDTFTINASDVAMDIRGRDGNDSFTLETMGIGMMTIDGQAGDDSFSILNTGANVMLSGSGGNDSFLISDDIGVGSIDASGGDGNDDFLVEHAGATGVALRGDDGEDSFVIDNDGSAPITAMGGAGNDMFNVIKSGTGSITLMGQVGDDTYMASNIDATISFVIDDSVDAESDTLLAGGTDGDDVFDIVSDGVIVNGGVKWEVNGIENFEYDGLAGNDVFNVDMGNGWNDSLILHGGDGNDSMVINDSGSGTVSLFGDAGDDSYTVFFKPNTNVTISDSVDAEADAFFGFGTEGVDIFSLNSSSADVNGGMVSISGVESVEFDALGSADILNIDSSIGNSTFRGGNGNDTFNIAETADGNVFAGDAGNDVFNIDSSTGDADFLGGDGNDIFNLTQSTGLGDYFGGIGDDVFNIGEVSGLNRFFGEAGVDRFIVTNHLPLGTDGLIEIDGGLNRNQIVINGYQNAGNEVLVTSNQITGLSAVPVMYEADGNFTIPNGVGGIQLIGSDGFDDRFNVTSLFEQHSLSMLGGGGDDLFIARSSAIGAVTADGQEGSDVYRYDIGSDNNRTLFALDSGVNGSDRIVATLTELDDNLVLSGESFAVRTDNFGFNQNFESLVVNSLGGNDEIEINRLSVDFLRILSGAGDDAVNVNNFLGVGTISIDMGTGNDTLFVDSGAASGFLSAFGGDGDDLMTITQRSYGNAVIDGQNGSDTYNITIADRSSRYIVARDSGSFGTDQLQVVGTILPDFVTFRAGIVTSAQQSILYSQTTEAMTLMAGGSDDNITVYGVSSPMTNIMSQDGNDRVFVNSTFGPATSKTLNIDLGLGNDNLLAASTTAESVTNIFGREGSDLINLGSSFVSNNGSLDVLYGEVNVVGDSGDDRLYINDAGKGASFNYRIGQNFVRNGGSNSNFFGGITFDSSIETLRLDATNFRNHINVDPNMNTKFSFFGNGGYNTISLLGNPDDDGREFFGDNGGVGTWTFDNGAKDIFFSDFFLI